jgi:hypothetical protein
VLHASCKHNNYYVLRKRSANTSCVIPPYSPAYDVLRLLRSGAQKIVLIMQSVRGSRERASCLEKHRMMARARFHSLGVLEIDDKAKAVPVSTASPSLKRAKEMCRKSRWRRAIHFRSPSWSEFLTPTRHDLCGTQGGPLYAGRVLPWRGRQKERYNDSTKAQVNYGVN